MKVVRALTSFGLAVAALCAVSLGSDNMSAMDVDDAQAVQAGQAAAFTYQCFQNVSDCLACTANNTSCTQAGRIDTCRLTPPPTLCAVLLNPPACGLLITWTMPNCGGFGLVNPNNFCFEFICV